MEIDDECLICPYNTSHIISAIRMPYHLIKCRKNYPSVELVVCPFNANHEVNKPELKHHMLHCPSRVLLEREITFDAMRRATKDNDPPIKKGFTDLPRYRDHHVNDDNDENWDTADDSQGFLLRSSRRSQHRRDDENFSLRRPFSHTLAEVTESSGTDHSNTSSPGPHNSFNFKAPFLGRGRARPALSPDRALSTSTLTSGQSHVLQPNNIQSLWPTKPDLSDIAWAFGRGRGSSFKYQ